jgi:hypothetical protein
MGKSEIVAICEKRKVVLARRLTMEAYHVWLASGYKIVLLTPKATEKSK